jgi:hypothetical protein
MSLPALQRQVPTGGVGAIKPREYKKMRPILTKPAQSQIMLSALFVAALSFITLAASFAEMPAEAADIAVVASE